MFDKEFLIVNILQQENIKGILRSYVKIHKTDFLHHIG